MPAPKRQYSRLYHDLVDDPMFADVYPDDAAFGAWAKMLMLADAIWPSSAPIPAGLGKSRLRRLTESALVTVTGGRFRIRGLDKERERRSKRGKDAAEGRWHPEEDADASDDDMHTHPPGNAEGMHTHPDSNAKGMPRQDETRQDEQSRAETSSGRTTPPVSGESQHPTVH